MNAQVGTGFDNPYYTTGVRIAPSTLVPTARRWYLPQRLYQVYGWRPEAYTNYARERFQVYNPIALEGLPYYDQYGEYVTRGWEVFNWTEAYPQRNGSNIFKDPRFSSWFRHVVISSSSRGQYHTSLMAGDGIRTTLTPLTFSKPRFDGVQWDFLSDKYAATVLLSRVSHTGDIANFSGDPPITVDPFTNLYGFRGEAQVGDFARMGFTFVNAAHRTTDLKFNDNSMKGVLAGPLNTDFVRSIIVRISDDSPEDGEGGALLSRWRIFINDVEHTENIQPIIEGGLRHRGVIEASGHDVITLTFNLENFAPGIEDEIDDFRQIRHVDIGLVLANDYRVEVSSNRQTGSQGNPVFLPVMRADGNVKDGSNQAYHQFRYGLPTGNRVVGFTLDVENVGGFSVRSEVARSYQYRRFPNENITTDQALATNTGDAFYITAQKNRYPWLLFAEAFSMDQDYSTTAFMPTPQGRVFYDNEQLNLYEFVDNNDDQDELPDWTRRYFGPPVNTRFGRNLRTDDAVFPGMDESQDGIPDFNRNFNHLPDYVEPFLRFEVDPPEFLFGVDMNNNTIIDRFEATDEASYPYRKGRRGYNAYVGLEIYPGIEIKAGRLDRKLLKTDRQDMSHYLLMTFQRDMPHRNLRLWLIANPRRVKDDIPDDVFIWVQRPGSRGESRLFRDPLIAKDAFINTTYFELEYYRYLFFQTKVKHDFYHQYNASELRDKRFLGIINKAEYPIELFGWNVNPRWKQQYANTVPPRQEDLKTEELYQIFSLILDRRLTEEITITNGAELELFRNLRSRPDPLPAGFEEDANTIILASQVSNVSAYQGYLVTTNVGLQWSRRNVKDSKAASELSTFITVYAGMGTDR